MSYRNITVDGKQYQYALGKQFLKIKLDGKHFKLVKTSEVGNELYSTGRFIVTPSTVAKVIKGEELPQVFYCERHEHATTKLAYDPFEAEIYNRYPQMMHCPECIENRAMDI